MLFLNRFTIFQRLLFLSGIALAGLLCVAGIGVVALSETLVASQHVVGVSKRIESLSERSLTALLNIRRYEKDLLLNMGDPVRQDDYQNKWNASLADARQLYSEIAVTAPEYRPLRDRLNSGLTEYETKSRSVLQTAVAGGYSNPREANDAISVVAKVVIHRMEEDLKDSGKKAAEGASQAWAFAESRAQLARSAMLGFSILAGLVCVLGMLTVALGVRKSLGRGVSLSQAIAGERD